MRMSINKVSIRGFLSVGDSIVDLHDKGLVLVSGVNESPDNQDSNGAGKSTVFEAIIFVLTGTTMRGTKDVINKFMKEKYADVSLDFEVDEDHYIVRRTRAHPDHGNNLFILKNETDISGDKLKKSEQILKSELPRITTNLLSSVIILGQGLPNKFTSLTPIHRKERLEELAETSNFINKLKDDLSLANKEISQMMTTTKIDESSVKSRLDTNKSTLRRKSEELVKFNNEFVDIDELRNKYEELKNIINNQESKRNELDKQVRELNNEWNSDLAKYNDGNHLLSQIKSDGSSLFNQKNNLMNSRNCPTCGRPYDESTQRNISMNIDSLDDQIQVKTEEMGKAQDNLLLLKDALDKSKKELDDKSNELHSLPSLVSLTSELSSINSKISKYDAMTTSINEEIKNLKYSIVADEGQVSIFTDKLSKLITNESSIKFLDKLAKKEFRSYMLQGIINYVDGKMKEYNESLSGNRDISMFMEKDRLEISYNNTPYESLSGGERQRCDLAVQFSLRDMLINSIGFSCDLLALDEVFDNLDEAGTNAVINLIASMSSLGTVGVISHHPAIPLPYDNKITAIKNSDRITTITQ